MLPTSARLVPANKEGKRKCGAWEFHYVGWENSDKQHRRGDTTIIVLPDKI